MRVEKENGGLCLLPSKTNRGQFAQISKGSLQVHNAKNFTVPKPQALRKALGNINQVQSRKTASTKVDKRENSVKQRPEKYPEIETFIPYNPLGTMSYPPSVIDFETFDVPEEHKLSDRCLAGVPLFVSRDDAIRFDVLASPVFSPMENEPINYGKYLGYFFETFIPLFEDITIDLPLL
ncbi:securin-like [Rhinoderma darwinii]|uniref:securin-like n=1 Tax=Rhinoderma darwinii TaxID=43563 RepID=UPI003F67E522